MLVVERRENPQRAFGSELCGYGHEPALPVFNTDASPLKCVCAVSYFG